MEGRKLYIIITAPHSGCVSETGARTCDSRAGEAGTLLRSLFYEERIPCSLYLAKDVFGRPILRSDIDLNRPPAKATKWYKKIQRQIELNNKVGMNTVILDCHSFPEEGKKMMVFRTPGVFDPLMDMYTELSTSLRGMVELVCGTDSNFITKQATLMDIPSVLLEFNEYESVLSKSELKTACEIIVKHTLSPTVLEMKTKEAQEHVCADLHTVF